MSTLAQSHIPTPKYDKHKKPEMLGEVLKVWNYCKTFQYSFKFEPFSKEEIYYAFAYEGDLFLERLHELHASVCSLFLNEFEEKTKFINQSKFFTLFYTISRPIRNQMLVIFWPEVVKQLFQMAEFQKYNTSSFALDLEKLINCSTPKDYNSLSPLNKMNILSTLIDASYELNLIRQEIAKMQEQYRALDVKNSELAEAVTKESLDLTKKTEKHQKLERASERNEQNNFNVSSNNSCSSLEDKSKGNTKTKFQSMEDKLASLSAKIKEIELSLTQKNDLLLEGLKAQSLILHNVKFLGTDRNSVQYWFFSYDDKCIYIRNPKLGLDNWFFYNAMGEVESLLNFLDLQNFFEKKIYDNIQYLLKNRILNCSVENLGNMVNEDYEITKNSILSELLLYQAERPFTLFDIQIKNKQFTKLLLTFRREFSSTTYCCMHTLEYAKKIISYLEDLFSEYHFTKNSFWTTNRELELLPLEKANTPNELKLITLGLYKSFKTVKQVIDTNVEKIKFPNRDQSNEFFPRRTRIASELEEKCLKNFKYFPEHGDTRRIKVNLFGTKNIYIKDVWKLYVAENGENFYGLFFSICIFCNVMLNYIFRKMEKSDVSSYSYDIIDFNDYSYNSQTKTRSQASYKPKNFKSETSNKDSNNGSKEYGYHLRNYKKKNF